MESTIVPTSFGEVSLSDLVRQYERVKKNNTNVYEKRKEFFKTEEGKQLNRARSKAYYEKNKEKILEKRHRAYAPKRKRIPKNKPDAEASVWKEFA